MLIGVDVLFSPCLVLRVNDPVLVAAFLSPSGLFGSQWFMNRLHENFAYAAVVNALFVGTRYVAVAV